MQRLLIVGLGNPTQQYLNNRHNVGFMVLDRLADLFEISFKEHKNLKSSLAFHPNFILCKPLTFMNSSGEAVRLVQDYYKTDELFVIHDELEILPNSLRFKRSGGSGGHNGLKSIDLHCGNDYMRARCGIGRPERKEEVVHYVLSDFPRMPTEMIQTCADAIGYFIQTQDFLKMQNLFTSRA